MSGRTVSRLGYALLGLLQQQPASGYELRKIFSATSMKTYSDSPGAIYPALQRLEEDGLIRGAIQQGAGLRRRRMFRLTKAGLSALTKWITRPVTVEELVWSEQEILLRFAFSEGVVGADGAHALLKSLEAALKTYLPALRQEWANLPSAAPASGRLAFECGLQQYECLLRWAQSAIETYEKERKGEMP